MTNVLVAFATRSGTTQAIAERLGARLTEAGHQATVVPVQDNPDPSAYETVVIGSGVLNGTVYAAAEEWLTARRAGLEKRPTAAFVTCLILPDTAEQRAVAQGYPGQLAAELPAAPLSTAVFTGTYDPSTRTRWERLATWFTRAPKGEFRDWDTVDAWAEELAGRL